METIYQFCKFGITQLAKAYGLTINIGGNQFPGSPLLKKLLGEVDGTPVSLLSVFAYLDTNAEQTTLPIQSVQLNANFFSFKAPDAQATTLLKKALVELATLTDSSEVYCDLALQILERFGATVGINQADAHVSLLDGIKVGAALDSAFAINPKGVLLVNGGLSGIQDYIYTIISKTASKSLKGRSFYLQLLADAVVRFLLKKLNLTDFHSVYESGGGFMLIVPDTTDNRTTIRQQYDLINRSLYEEHQQRLSLTLEFEAIPADELKGFRLTSHLKQLFHKQNQQKKRKLLPVILNNPTAFFQKKGKVGNWLRDAVTKEELPELPNGEANKYQLYKDKGEQASTEMAWVGPITFQQVELGKRLKTLSCIAITDSTTSLSESTNLLTIDFPFAKLRYHIFRQEDDQQLVDRSARVYYYNQPNRLLASGRYTKLYGGNNIPFSENEAGETVPMTFDEMGGTGSFKRLGVLRMDVDNLGKVFSDEVESLWTLANLSRSMDLFFKGYLNTIWEQGYSENTAIIYAGGDDLFLVGKWDEVVNLAASIRAAFNTWVGQSQRFTLSGGIAIVNPKYPIMRGAAIAKKAEKKAKLYDYEGEYFNQSKNALFFLGKAYNWEDEFPKLIQLKEEILAYVMASNNHSVFSRIASYNELKEAAGGGPGKWRWMINYDMVRLKERLPANKKHLGKTIQGWLNASLSNEWSNHKFNNQGFLAFFATAARWAELEYRTKK